MNGMRTHLGAGAGAAPPESSYPGLRLRLTPGYWPQRLRRCGEAVDGLAWIETGLMSDGIAGKNYSVTDFGARGAAASSPALASEASQRRVCETLISRPGWGGGV